MPIITTTNIATGLLAPVITLNLWTFTMEAWMYATRLPAVEKYKLPTHPSSTMEEFNKKMPAHIRWVADNYNHLHEQPTQFYAVALTLAFLGAEDRTTSALAWTYVGLRVVHSLVQAISNKIMLRFQCFVLSSFVLFGMTARAVMLLV